MEDINNNIVTPDPPVIQPVKTSPIPPTTSSNIFKYLFFISIFIFITGIAITILIFKNYTKEPVIKETNNNTVQTTEDTKTIPTIEKKENILYQVKSVDDSENKKVSLFLTSNKGNEILVDETKIWELPTNNQKIIPRFTNTEVSPSNNYLFYYLSSGYEGGSSFLYNIKSKEKINLEMSSETYGYDKNEKYFYTCSGPGMDQGGASIYKLPTMELIYKASGTCYRCQLNSNNNIEIIEHESCVPINPKKIEFLTETEMIK